MKPGVENSDSEDDTENLQYKVVILGDVGVGKTSIVNRYVDDQVFPIQIVFSVPVTEAQVERVAVKKI